MGPFAFQHWGNGAEGKWSSLNNNNSSAQSGGLFFTIAGGIKTVGTNVCICILT